MYKQPFKSSAYETATHMSERFEEKYKYTQLRNFVIQKSKNKFKSDEPFKLRLNI